MISRPCQMRTSGFRTCYPLEASVLAAFLLISWVPLGATEDSLYSAPFLLFETGGNPWSLAVGDFNQDGNPDVVTVNQTQDQISVHLGNGDGSIGLATAFPVGIGPRSVVATHVNPDAYLDLAVANETGNSLTILAGQGDGTFSTVSTIDLGLGAHQVAAGHLNPDSFIDLVKMNGSQKLSGILKKTKASERRIVDHNIVV